MFQTALGSETKKIEMNLSELDKTMIKKIKLTDIQ